MKVFLITLLILLFSTLLSVGYTKNKLLCSTQLLANRTEVGFTWTITSRLSEILHNAEKRYGKRDPSWTLLGVEFTHSAQPNVWYPFINQGRKHLIIQLPKAVSTHEKKALYQLSHEVIHLLSPSGGKNSSVFEEGLATYFAIKNMQALQYDIDEHYIAGKKYKKAYKLIDTLYKNFPNTDNRIKVLRTQTKKLRDITPEQFSYAFSGLSLKYATLLAKDYSKWDINGSLYSSTNK